ncbi:hypothetical protein MRY87_01015, partial [bacterium]|nr:hypothetical protein [bacterium]
MPTVTQREQRAVQQRGIPTAEGSSSVADERRGGQLLEQFSSLLDQISIQLEQAQSAEAIAPAPLVAPSRKAEALPQQLHGEGSEASSPSQEEGKAEVKESGAAHEAPVSEGESAAPEEHEVAADAEAEEAPQTLAVEIPSESEPEDVVAEAPLPEGVIPVVLETEELVSPELLVEAEEPTEAEVAPVLVEAATVESLAPEQEVVSPSSGTAAASLGEQPKVVEGEKVLASPQGELASGEGGAPSETFSKPEQLPPTLPRDLSEPKGESEHIMREVKELFDAAGRFSASTPQAPREGAEESALVRAFHSALQERAPQTPLQTPGDQPLPQQGASLAPSPRSEFFSSLFSGSASRSGGELPFGKVGDIVTQMQSRGDSNPQGNTGGQLGLGEKIKTASEKMEKAVTEELSKGQELRTME